MRESGGRKSTLLPRQNGRRFPAFPVLVVASKALRQDRRDVRGNEKGKKKSKREEGRGEKK